MRRKQEEIERNFLLENSAFKIELLSPRPEHNNKKYDTFDQKVFNYTIYQKRDKEDQQVERISRIKTL